jgi:hypothetical protein
VAHSTTKPRHIPEKKTAECKSKCKSPTGRPRSRREQQSYKYNFNFNVNPLNTELNPICHLLALLGAHHILHVSRIRVNHTCKTAATPVDIM